MTAIDALHGRNRAKRAQRLCCRLFVVVALTFVVLKLEQLARICTAEAARRSADSRRVGLAWASVWIQLATVGVLVAGSAIGGMLVDWLGVRRTVGLALIGWCGLTVIGGTLDAFSYASLAPLVTNLLPGLLSTAALVAVRNGMTARRRGPAIALLFIAVDYAWSQRYPLELYLALFGGDPAEGPSNWPSPMFALSTIGAAIAVIWLLAVPDSDRATGIDLGPSVTRSSHTILRDAARMLGDPLIWSLAAIQALNIFVGYYALDQFWNVEMLAYGAVKNPVLLTVVTIPIASVLFAGWSDWVLRRTRSFLRARRPFLVVGFLLGGVAPLLATASSQHRTELTLIAALGLAAMRVADLVIVDLAPRRTAGTSIGLVLTASALLTLLMSTLVSSVAPSAWMPPLIAALGVAGAAASAFLLPRFRVPDDSKRDSDRLSSHF